MLKDNIEILKFSNEHELKLKILEFIMLSKSDKIVYKGNPKEIKYKLLKKIMDVDSNIKEKYLNYIKDFEKDLCIIYKK